MNADQEIFGIQNADNIILGLGIYRYPGKSFPGDELQHLRDPDLYVSADHFGSRRHDLMNEGIPELKNTADHLPFLVCDQALLFAFFQKFLNFHFKVFSCIRRTA